MNHQPSVSALLARLPEMHMDALWSLWDKHFPVRPKNHHRGFVQSRLAYKIQELAYGGLHAATRRQLERIGESGEVPRKYKKGGQPLVAPGTILVREYDGREVRVTATPDGRFEYNGTVYRSLTAITRHLTGALWSGPSFFGLVRRSKS